MMNFFSLTEPKRLRKGAVRMSSMVAAFLLTSLISFNLFSSECERFWKSDRYKRRRIAWRYCTS